MYEHIFYPHYTTDHSSIYRRIAYIHLDDRSHGIMVTQQWQRFSRHGLLRLSTLPFWVLFSRIPEKFCTGSRFKSGIKQFQYTPTTTMLSSSWSPCFMVFDHHMSDGQIGQSFMVKSPWRPYVYHAKVLIGAIVANGDGLFSHFFLREVPWLRYACVYI